MGWYVFRLLWPAGVTFTSWNCGQLFWPLARVVQCNVIVKMFLLYRLDSNPRLHIMPRPRGSRFNLDLAVRKTSQRSFPELDRCDVGVGVRDALGRARLSRSTRLQREVGAQARNSRSQPEARSGNGAGNDHPGESAWPINLAHVFNVGLCLWFYQPRDT